MDLNVEIEKLNKIKDVKGKLKYLEQLLFGNTDEKNKKQILKIIRMVQKSEGKRLSFEEIHKAEELSDNELDITTKAVAKKKTAAIPLEDMLFRRQESFGESQESEEKPFRLQEVVEATLAGTTQISPNAEIKKNEYKTSEGYKIENKEAYTPAQQFESEYRPPTAEQTLISETSRAADGGTNFRKFGANAESFSKENEEGIGEYKKQDIFSKTIEREEKEKREYQRKLKTGMI